MRPSLTGAKLLAFAGFLIVLGLAALPPAGSSPIQRVLANSSQGVRLSNDAGGAALFQVGDLAPGHPAVSCVAVSHDNATPGSQVSLYAELTDPDLARYLHMTIEVGSGGGNGSCDGFAAGSPLYAGLLTEFADKHHDAASGLPALRVDYADGAATYRVTAEVQDVAEAQDRRTEFDLIWSAPGPAAGAPAPGRTALPPSQAPGAAPAVTPVTPGPAQPAQQAESAPKKKDKTVVGRAVDAVVDAARKLAVPVARTAPIGAAASLLVATFMLIQHRIDGLDPKLALAPVRPPEHMSFVDRSEIR